ncbi:MAG TPA: hypothetical protein VJP88_08140 [Caulobacteraceae bacterium]|nr:hypothetical protein [Caulobacteraceae bacterium]
MSATPDWMRDAQTPKRPERERSGARGVLTWAAVIAATTFAALAILQFVG